MSSLASFSFAGTSSPTTNTLRPSTIYLGDNQQHANLLKSLQKKDPKTITSTLLLLPPLLSSSPPTLRPFLSTFSTLLPSLLSSEITGIPLGTLKFLEGCYTTIPKISKALFEEHVITMLQLNFNSSKQIQSQSKILTPLLLTQHPSILSSITSKLNSKPSLTTYKLLTLFPPSKNLLNHLTSEPEKNDILCTHLIKPTSHDPIILEYSEYLNFFEAGVSENVGIVVAVTSYGDNKNTNIISVAPESALILTLLSYKNNRTADTSFFGKLLEGEDRMEACFFTKDLIKVDLVNVRRSVWRWKLSEFYSWWINISYDDFLSLMGEGEYVHCEELLEMVLEWKEEKGFERVVFFMWESFKDVEIGRRRQYENREIRKWRILKCSGVNWGGKEYPCNLKMLESVIGQSGYHNENWINLKIDSKKMDFKFVKELPKKYWKRVLEEEIEDEDICEYIVEEWDVGIEDFWGRNFGRIKKEPRLGVCVKALEVCGDDEFWKILIDTKKREPNFTHSIPTKLYPLLTINYISDYKTVTDLLLSNFSGIPSSIIKYLPVDIKELIKENCIERLDSGKLKECYTKLSFKKRERVWCKRGDDVTECEILNVHKDDYPRLYYTLKSDDSEFQSDNITAKFPTFSSDLPTPNEEEIMKVVNRMGEEGGPECVRVFMEGYEGRKGLGSLHSVIRKKLTSLSSGEKRRKAFIGLGGKYGVGWSRIADDVETFVEDFLNVNGYVGVWGDVSFWVGEERLKGIQGGLSVYMNGNAMNWKGFREGLEDCCKVQRSLARNKFPNLQTDLPNVKHVVRLFVKYPEEMKNSVSEFFKTCKVRNGEFEQFIVESVKIYSGGLMEMLGRGEVGYLAFRFLEVLARLGGEKNGEVPDEEFNVIRKNVETRFGGWEVEEREEVEETIAWAVGVLPEALREVFEGQDGISCVKEGKVTPQPDILEESAEAKIERMIAKTLSFVLLATYAERSEQVAKYCEYVGEGVDNVVEFLASLVEPGFETEVWVKCLDGYDSECGAETYLQNLSNFAFLKALTTRLMKSWYSSVRNKENKLNAENFVALRGRKIVVKGEVDTILKAGRGQLGEMEVMGNVTTGLITAKYMQDECALSVTVILPQTYPLTDARIDTANSLEVPGKKWGLALSCMLKAGSGILDALLLWKDNIDCEFTGVEPCPICYAVLDPKSRCVPSLECGTCSNKFHRGCLVKWFAQSGKEACVICQQETINIGGGRRGRR